MSIGCGKNLMLTSTFFMGPLLQWETAFHGVFAESSNRAAPQSEAVWSMQYEQETLCLAWSGGAPWRWCLLHLLAACGLFPHGELGAPHSPLPSACSGYFLPLLPSAVPHSVPAMGRVCKRNGRKVAWWMQCVLYVGFVQDPKKLKGLFSLTTMIHALGKGV